MLIPIIFGAIAVLVIVFLFVFNIKTLNNKKGPSIASSEQLPSDRRNSTASLEAPKELAPTPQEVQLERAPNNDDFYRKTLRQLKASQQLRPPAVRSQADSEYRAALRAMGNRKKDSS